MARRRAIELTESELVVLDAALSRLADRPDFEVLVPEAADRQAIHNLVCLLERDDPFVVAQDYAERLDAARREVVPPDDRSG